MSVLAARGRRGALIAKETLNDLVVQDPRWQAQNASKRSIQRRLQPDEFHQTPNMSSGYSESCYLHNYQLENLRSTQQAQISSRNTMITDEAPRMPLHIHLKNLDSHSTSPSSLKCPHHPFQSLLNIHGAPYHPHSSCARPVCRPSLELRVL